jgi:hypothetical protein
VAGNKIFNFGPIALTTTLTTNLLNPAAASGGVNASANTSLSLQGEGEVGVA